MAYGLLVASRGIAVYLQRTEEESRLPGLVLCGLTPLIWGAFLWLNKRYGYYVLRRIQRVIVLIAIIPLAWVYNTVYRHLENQATAEPLAGLTIAMFTLWGMSLLFVLKMQEVVCALAGRPLVKIASEK